ncbi:MAG: DUF1836 domain-containing protein [Oscillospiraceae bacterium]|nr:DUF1836 domain-containing protein [Oscillospiraceae bacterium]MBQ4538658.1 DUF1836 domain-containing protein [Oscillospiraceae bacterium]
MTSANELINKSLDKSYMLPDELPAIDLYIDQVTTLISQRYQNNSFPANDKPLTKMMVNNYSKAGLIKPIKGKKYTREQIIQMLVICAMKGVLSLSEIKDILDGLYSDETFDEEQFSRCYKQAIEHQQKTRKKLKDFLAETLNCDSREDQFASLMAVCAMADSLSELAKRMAAEYFPPVEIERRSKKKDNG